MNDEFELQEDERIQVLFDSKHAEWAAWNWNYINGSSNRKGGVSENLKTALEDAQSHLLSVRKPVDPTYKEVIDAVCDLHVPVSRIFADFLVARPELAREFIAECEAKKNG